MRTRKAFLNMTTSLIYQVIAIACGLITPRLLLIAFGSTYTGVVTSASQFLNIFNILIIGISGATKVALYKPLAVKDTLGISRIMKATNQYLRKVALCVIAYSGVLCLVYPLISHNDLSKMENAMLIAIVSIGTFAEYFFGVSNLIILQAAQATYVINIQNIFKTIINTICTAVFIYFGCSIYMVKLGSSIIFVILPAIVHFYVKKKYNLTNHCEPDSTGIQQRGAVAFHSLANILHSNTDIIVLTLFADVKEIAVYNIYYLVVGKIKTLLQVFTSGMEAAFGDMWVKGEMETLQKNFRTFEYLLFSFTSVIFSCLGILILPFIEIYTKGVTDTEYIRSVLAILITITEGIYCIRQPYLTLVYATGSYQETKNGALVEALVNVVLTFALVPLFGISGAIIGTLVANVFRTTQFAIYISKNILNRNITEVVKRVLWVLLNIAIIIGISCVLLHFVSFSVTWFGWLAEAFVVFIIAVIVTLIMSFLFYCKDLRNLVELLIRTIKK